MMNIVRTRDEAIASVDLALQRWATETTGVVVQARSTANAASRRAEAAVSKWANRVAAIQALLSAASEERRDALVAELCEAQEKLSRAVRARTRIRSVEERLTGLGRTAGRATGSQTPEARAQLRAMSSALDAYRAAGRGIGGAVHGGGGGIHRAYLNGNELAPLGNELAPLGLALLDVGSADLEENPILDDSTDTQPYKFGRDGLTRADYRWLVQTWDDVVGPGVASGQSRDDFEERDALSNAVPTRRTVDVYDLFIKPDNRIEVERREDGSLRVLNGRHRFLIARELGIKSLPGKVQWSAVS